MTDSQFSQLIDVLERIDANLGVIADSISAINSREVRKIQAGLESAKGVRVPNERGPS